MVSPLCYWKKILLAKLCKCTKKLTSSPGSLRPVMSIAIFGALAMQTVLSVSFAILIEHGV